MTTVIKEPQFFVEIVRDEDSKVMKCMGPHDRRKAERIGSGAGINLDHTHFHVRLTPAAKHRKARCEVTE